MDNKPDKLPPILRLVKFLDWFPPTKSSLYFQEAVIRSLQDEQPQEADIAYLVGETAQNQFSVLRKGADHYKAGRVKALALPGFEAISGFPGFSVWRDELLLLGVPPEAIIPVPYVTRKRQTTKTEAVDLIAYAKQQSWHKIIAIAAPFHMPRAFFNIIKQILKKDKAIQVYADPGYVLPWTEVVTHSQGLITGPRTDLNRMEMIFCRIDIMRFAAPSPYTTLHYLNHRGL